MAWERHLLPVFNQQNTAFQLADQLRTQGSLCHASLGLGQRGTALFGHPQPSRRRSSRATHRAAGNRQESSEQVGRGLGWGGGPPLPGVGGGFEASTETGGAAGWRGRRRAREFLNKRNVTGKKHGRNKRKFPTRSNSAKQLLRKVSGRRVKGGQGRAVEGLIRSVTAAGLDPYTRVLSPGSSRMPWEVKKGERYLNPDIQNQVFRGGTRDSPSKTLYK